MKYPGHQFVDQISLLAKLVQLMTLLLVHIHQYYVDDTQLFLDFNPTEQHPAVKACVGDIRRWRHDNKLQLNEDQTELIIISPVTFFIIYFF